MTRTATTSPGTEQPTRREEQGAGVSTNERPTSAAATSKPGAGDEMRCTLCGLSVCWT